MKRSEINQLMKDAVHFIDSLGFVMPPFAFWSSQMPGVSCWEKSPL